MAEVTKVIMKAGDEEREFALTHAQDILNYQIEKRFTTGWQLKPGSGYEFKDGIINSTNSGTAKNASKQLGDSGSGKP